MPRVATLVLNWNGKADTLECLASLRQVDWGAWDHRTVVADNGSSDGSPEAIEAAFPDAVVLRNQANLGFAEGNNRAIDWARANGVDYIVLLNNDTIVDASTFPLLVQFAEAHPRAGAVMPLIKFYENEEVWYAGGGWVEPFGRMEPITVARSSEPYRTQLFTGCCVVFPISVLDRVGGLDSRFFMYFEDTELALRMADAGYETWVLPAVLVRHKVSRSSGGVVSPLAVYYQTRNNLMLIRQRMRGTARRAIGYGYIVALTAKISLNLLTRPVPRRGAVARALGQAWGDFLMGRMGVRTKRIG